MKLDHKIFNRLRDFFTEVPRIQSPDTWLEENFIFDEEEIKGQWDFKGRNYLRHIVNDNASVEVRRQTTVTGTGAGKTIAAIGGICWKIRHKPFRGLFVMPASKGEGGAGSFSGTRIIPDIDATPCLAELLPEGGMKRYKANNQFLRINGCHV